MSTLPVAGLGPGRNDGAILLEVIFALALLVAFSSVLLTGLAGSQAHARHVALQADAADLAVTLLSEIQLGEIPPVDAGPTEYEDYPGWQWQVITSDFSDQIFLDPTQPAEQTVRIIIARTDSPFSYELFHVLEPQP
jgi:type II secretory pathway pseudopilin PulG